MNRLRLTVLSGVALGVLAFVVAGWCQGNLGGLTGNVTDAAGSAVPDAAVNVTNLDTGATVSAISTSDGSYLVPSLPPGRYRVMVTRTGFSTLTKEPVVVSTATVSTLDFSLVVGVLTQSVEVTASPIQLQTTSAEIGTVVPQKEILDLPISLGGAATIGATGRRQIENFLFLTPGVTGNQWSKQINGAPSFSTEVLIDGEDMQNLGAPGFIADSAPPYEAMGEFKVQNTLYPAEYGLGYGVENFTMKSGTNHFHGDLFEFLRNDVLDARSFFSATRPVIRQNEFGGTIGGPVILPHYNGKDKTHFFFAWSGFRLRGGLPTPGLVSLPSMQERTGNFSDYPFPIYNPATTRPDGSGSFIRDPFPGNVIQPGQISLVAQRLMSLLPPPDLPGKPLFNYVDRSNQPSTDDDWSVKIDHQINAKQQLSGAFWWVNADTVIHGQVAGPLDQGFRHTPTHGGGLRINHEYSVTTTFLNHIGFGYTPTQPTWTLWKLDPRLGNQTLKIPGIPSDAHGFTEFHFDNPAYPFFGNSMENGFDPQKYVNWVFNDDLSWVKGRHQLKFGFEYRRRSNDAQDLDNTAGTFFFSNMSSSQPDSLNFANWGNSFASLMLGQVISGSHAIPAPEQHFPDSLFAFYGEDTIKISDKVTLNLGLRYELPIYVIEDRGIASFLSLTRPNPGAGGLPGALVFLGNGTGRTGTFNIFGHYHNAFSPRVALTCAANSKTVLRLGYGVFRIYPNYGRMNSGIFWNSGFGAIPSVASTDSGVTPAFNLDQGFPPSNITLPDLDPALNNGGFATYVNQSANRPAFMQSWTVDIQRTLPFSIMLDTAYVGSHTTGLWTGLENIDQVNSKYLSLGNTLLQDISSPAAAAAGVRSPYPGFTGSVAQALRPFPQYTTIWDMFQPTGYNVYHSLQVRLQKQYSNGLSFLGSYTLSKNIGTEGGDTFGDIFGGGGLPSLDTFNRKIEKTIEPIDQTHVFVFSSVYELPFGRGKRFLTSLNPVANQLVGGWQVNSIETYESGTPIGVGGGGNIPLFGGGNRPNLISSNVRSSASLGNFDPNTQLYLNINAFSQPAPFTFGTAPPLLPNVRTPAFYDEDFSLFKRVSLKSESRYVEFRAEFFNLFNRVVFGGPSANINNPSTFGVISSQANTPRVIQFGLKLIF